MQYRGIRIHLGHISALMPHESQLLLLFGEYNLLSVYSLSNGKTSFTITISIIPYFYQILTNYVESVYWSKMLLSPLYKFTLCIDVRR